MAVTVKTPAMTKVATEYNYLSTLDLAPEANGIHKPDVDPDLVYRYGRQDATGIMQAIGNTKTVSQDVVTHYEQERIHGTFRLAASAASGGTQLTADVASAYGFTTDANSPYVNTSLSATSYMPQVYDVIEANGVQMVITSVNGASLTAETLDSTDVVPEIAVSDDIIIPFNTVPEGSTATESRNSRWIKFESYLQKFRRDHVVTNTEAGNMTWVEVDTEKGSGYFWYLQALADEYHRFMNEREAALLTGKKLTNSAAAAGGTASYGDIGSITTTEGLIPQVSANGNVVNYSVTNFAYANIEAMALELNKNRGDMENFLFCGYDFGLEFDTVAREASGLANGGLIFNTFNGGEGQGVNFEIEYYKVGGYRFNKKNLDIFSDPQFLGYSGGIYRNLGIVVPVGDTVVYNSMSTASGERVPSMSILCKEDTNGSRMYQEWVTGHGLGASNSDFDGFKVHMLSNCGLQVPALNRYGLFVGEGL